MIKCNTCGSSVVEPLDFSIREEVKVALEAVGLMLNTDNILDMTMNDEVMLDAISYAIYDSIAYYLSLQGVEHEEVQYQLDMAKEALKKSVQKLY